jgi:ectoine hydroxylase-related dioxygenase (phytanoyl-CoA dioxygenase family)
MLCYLQDMDGPGGPLLAVPGSHRSAIGDKPEGAEEEAVVQVDAKAGDVVFFHCDMLHRGYLVTHPLSTKLRRVHLPKISF